ncbi:MAG TPA: YceI family protein [Solirubrobacterales bacterium]|nr:YceI family protein [Solirubrobacterales bacterium]
MSTQTITQQQIPAGTWVVDPVHSSINFAITHNAVTAFRSGFERYEARLSGGEQPRLEGTVEVESIAIDEEMLKGHLLSPEFFDAQRFPRLRFASSELSVDEDGTLRVVGDLEIRGETRRVAADGRFAHLGEDASGKPRVGLSISATVDRRDFGLDWQAQLPSGGEVLDYAVTINVELELVAEEA